MGKKVVMQMTGVLTLSRLPITSNGKNASHGPMPRSASKRRRMRVKLQPALCQLLYAAADDEALAQPLGCVDLRGAMLEQRDEKCFIIQASTKVVQLEDDDPATVQAWVMAIYSAIGEAPRPRVASMSGARFVAMIISSCRDEYSHTIVGFGSIGEEFELACQAILPQVFEHGQQQQPLKWTVWKTEAAFQELDDKMRGLLGNKMKRIVFPRDRIRDSLFGGLRKKSIQESKEQQLADYLEKVLALPDALTDPATIEQVRLFLRFDAFFDDSSKDSEVPSPIETMVYHTSHEEHSVHFATDDENQPEEIPATRLSSDGNNQREQDEAALSLSRSFLRQSSVSSIEDPSRIEAAGPEYMEIDPEDDPSASKALHKVIISTVRQHVFGDEDRVREFQALTKDFGRDKMTASEYCAFLHGCVGAIECLQLLPQMARLLPDDQKRDELMEARAAIWRRTMKRQRQRNRTKQFSEPASVWRSKNTDKHGLHPQVSVSGVAVKPRPKSDTFSLPSWSKHDSHNDHQATSRRSFSELKNDPEPFQSNVKAHVNGDSERRGAQEPPHTDPGLRRRSSLNVFGEVIHTDMINEESDLDSDDSLAPPPTRKQRAFSTSEEEESDSEYPSTRKRRPTSQKSSKLDASVVNAWPRTSLGISDTRSLDTGTEHTQISTTQNGVMHSSNQHHSIEERVQGNPWVKSAHENEKPEADQPLNPVLARLRKQGAVNFMMR